MEGERFFIRERWAFGAHVFVVLVWQLSLFIIISYLFGLVLQISLFWSHSAVNKMGLVTHQCDKMQFRWFVTLAVQFSLASVHAHVKITIPFFAPISRD